MTTSTSLKLQLALWWLHFCEVFFHILFVLMVHFLHTNNPFTKFAHCCYLKGFLFYWEMKIYFSWLMVYSMTYHLISGLFSLRFSDDSTCPGHMIIVKCQSLNYLRMGLHMDLKYQAGWLKARICCGFQWGVVYAININMFKISVKTTFFAIFEDDSTKVYS